MMSNILSLKNFTKSIAGKVILDSISFDIYHDEIVGLVGNNGAGKTTLIKSIMGLKKHDSGRIEYDGVDVTKNRKNFNGNIRCFFDCPVELFNLDYKEYLNYFRRLYDPLKRTKIQNEEILLKVGLKHAEVIGKSISAYSLGMKKRLYLSTLYINPPSLIIMDEPMSGLDPASLIVFRNVIQEIHHVYKSAFLISSHMLNELEKICNKYLVINGGNLTVMMTNESKKKRMCIKSKMVHVINEKIRKEKNDVIKIIKLDNFSNTIIMDVNIELQRVEDLIKYFIVENLEIGEFFEVVEENLMEAINADFKK